MVSPNLGHSKVCYVASKVSRRQTHSYATETLSNGDARILRWQVSTEGRNTCRPHTSWSFEGREPVLQHGDRCYPVDGVKCYGALMTHLKK